MMEAIHGTRAGSEKSRSRWEKNNLQHRLRRNARRVLPLRDPAGTVYGYMVRGARPGRMPHGPYASPELALEAALAETADERGTR